jgi:TonB family protein
MDHGTQAFFLERSRFRRRLALMVLTVSLVAYLPFAIVPLLPRAQRERVRVFLDQTPVHFGFEGPEQTVERMNLEAPLDVEFRRHLPRAMNTVIVPEAHKGGGELANAPSDARAFSDVVSDLPEGPGRSEADLMARAMAKAGSTPVFRSEQLIIEYMVRPDYPEEARAQLLEGRVAIMALIDTTGQVADVELMVGEPGGLLERAAEVAVRQTRFRPYRPDGVVRQVYALFRYAFRLDG